MIKCIDFLDKKLKISTDNIYLRILVYGKCQGHCVFCINAIEDIFENNKIDSLKQPYIKIFDSELKELINILKLFLLNNIKSNIVIVGDEPTMNLKIIKNLFNATSEFSLISRKILFTNGFFLFDNNPYEFIDMCIKNNCCIMLSRNHYNSEMNQELMQYNDENMSNFFIDKIDKLDKYFKTILLTKSIMTFQCLIIKGYIDSLDKCLKYVDTFNQHIENVNYNFSELLIYDNKITDHIIDKINHNNDRIFIQKYRSLHYNINNIINEALINKNLVFLNKVNFTEYITYSFIYKDHVLNFSTFDKLLEQYLKYNNLTTSIEFLV